ncbi:CG10035 [Drosophila busckii]|uniref:CG10035 n=1 Tax=Drosophila busckii TaxID=30019 RepID=A0A0M4ETA4_DROBS|nr:uncharacterized protein LOC108602450 [Drosophila busckii]XP_033149964.1 uncharacterized protein LOC108602450 [Drosophila busckii]ALC46042.1 CG10035 [Drosophila busckii]
MFTKSQCNKLLRLMLPLLVLCHKAYTLPALESAPVATAINTIEETDKLPDTIVEPNPDAVLVNANVNASASQTDATQEPATPDNVASASNIQPITYASGLITPEAFQQYLNQFGGAGLAPLAAYPAPMTAAPGMYPYPGPIVVQTGYEGFLVPVNAPHADSAADSNTVVAAAPKVHANVNPLLAFATKLLPSILMSTLFRVVAVVLSAVGVILFGSAITSTLCRLTPICEIPSKAVDYLRSGGAQDVGRMLAEEMTPERVRRTAEFVRNAIRKYQELQKIVE